jgi:hypothetical protein
MPQAPLREGITGGRVHALLAIVLFLWAVSVASACVSADVAGMYIARDDSYINLLGDGSFQTTSGIHGRWRSNGNQIALERPLGTEYAQMEGRNLTWRGTLYVRE